MTSQMNTKVRLVRCPRCRLVLPELADVPVYECGGCGTILQAKNQKKDANDTGSFVHEADPTQKNGLNYLMSPSTDESDLEKILERCGSGVGCRKEGLGDLNQSHKYHTSEVISCHENTGSSPEISGHAGAEEDELPLVQYGTKYHDELGDDDIELPGDISSANKILSSPELNRHEDKSLVHGPGNLSPRKEDGSQRSSENISYGSQNYSQYCLKELPTSTGFSGDLSSCYESCENGDLSSVSGTDREVDDSLKNHTNPEEQIRQAQSSPVASKTPDNQMIPLSEPTKQAEEETFPVFQRVSSTDTLENIPHVSARTDLGVTLRSSTAKHYYDYGVKTSCVETEDELPSQHLSPSKKNFNDAECRVTDGMPKKDELVVNYGMSSENKLPPRPIKLLATLSAEKHYTTKGRKWSRGEFHEDKSLVHGPGNMSPRKEDRSQRSSENISYGSQNYSQNCLKELSTSTVFSGDFSSCYESCDDGDLSSVSGTDREDESLKPHSNPENQIRKEQSSPVASKTPDNQMIPLSAPTKQAEEETFPVFQRVSSADTLENIPHVYSRTDLGVTLRSSTAKHYYDYGASTSCLGTEDELPSQHLRPSRRNFKDAESRITNSMPERDELVANYGMSSENKLPPRPINPLATLSAKKHYTTKGNKWSRGEFQEPTQRSRPVSSKMTTETNEYRSRPPIYLKGSQVRNENRTSYEPKGLPARTVDPESKTQLLRMVYELQDQLKRVHISKGMPHSRDSSGVAQTEQLPAYSNLFAPNGERYPYLRYAFNPGQLDQVKTYFQHGKVPRMAFSGDAAHFRHEVDCSCLRCYRQKWHYSAQLPRHAYYDEGHSVLYSRGPRHSSHSPYHSASASPYQYRSSEFLWSHDTILDVIHQNNDEVKKKQQPAKQHFRPIAGAAPIIACYCCNEILQLPVDFLLLKRKCHRLRCSACTMVLKFSLVKGIHIVEYNSEPRTPPPSEVDGYTETTNLVSASCAVDYQHGDLAVSSCDGYGQSPHRSSTEIERSSPAPPSDTMNGIYQCQKMSAGNPFETKKDGKKPIEQDSTNSYNNTKNFELGGPSSKVYEPEKVFSEIEEVPPEDGSPLHQLMGYSSPSYII